MVSDVVTQRQINRTYLQRQLLLERSVMDLHEAVAHLVAVQAQDVLPPFVSLWSRLEQFDTCEIDAALQDRSLVRGSTLRATVHMTTRDDVMRLLPWMLPEYWKIAHGPSAINGLLKRVDAKEIEAWGMDLFRGRDLSGAELREAAHHAFPDHPPADVAAAALWILPLVQVPPRGLWKQNAKPRWALAAEWINQSLPEPGGLEAIILRYIRTYGPVGTGDFQTFSRITGAAAAFDALRPHLRTVKDEAGRTYLDDPEVEWPDADMPAPVRLLGHFDNALLSHKDRSRIVTEDLRVEVMHNGIGRSAILLDGFAAGRFKVVRKKDVATLVYDQFREWSDSERAEFVAEAERLLAFMEPDASHRIQRVDSILTWRA